MSDQVVFRVSLTLRDRACELGDLEVAVEERQRGTILKHPAVSILHADQMRGQHCEPRIPRHHHCEGSQQGIISSKQSRLHHHHHLPESRRNK